jgi:hypothetical protein
MGELADLIGIYGAIDRKVAEDDDRRAAVSNLLWLYREPVRWFDEFEAWTQDLRQDDRRRSPFPSLEEALQDLADIEPQGRMLARRLWVIALAAQAFPDLQRDDSELFALAREALHFGGLGADEDTAAAVLRLLGDVPVVDDGGEGDAADRWWEDLKLRLDGLIRAPHLLGPRPCTGKLVTLPGVVGEIAALETTFTTKLLPFDLATRFLDPTTWSGCSPLCCDVRPLGVAHRYREVVSVDCGRQPATWTIHADLDFRFHHVPGELAIAEYHLAPVDQPDVSVDEGSLVVHALGGGELRITTTKRVRFKRPFTGKQLAFIACALGYSSIVEDLIFTCALNGRPGKPVPPGVPEAGHPACAEPLDVLVTRAARAAEACIEDWTQTARASSQKIAEGRYTADDLVQDLARPWARMAREAAAIAAVPPAPVPAPPPAPAAPPAPAPEDE